MERLSTKAVKGAALSLECEDNIHGSYSFSASVLSVCDCVSNHVLQEDFEDAAGLLVDGARDTFDSSSACETADGGFGYALDIVAKYLAVALSP